MTAAGTDFLQSYHRGIRSQGSGYLGEKEAMIGKGIRKASEVLAIVYILILGLVRWMCSLWKFMQDMKPTQVTLRLNFTYKTLFLNNKSNSRCRGSLVFNQLLEVGCCLP